MNDSMLGGDDDDLEELVRDCGNQVEGQGLVTRNQSLQREDRGRTPSQEGSRGGTSHNQMQTILEQNAKLIALMT